VPDQTPNTTPAVFYAHTLPGQPQAAWETLDAHADNVACKAREFAAAFGAVEWGELLGLWHDLGKFRPEFQSKLRGLARLLFVPFMSC
jgi:CRISPR-associated endonuclease/helicase Cas3